MNSESNASSGHVQQSSDGEGQIKPERTHVARRRPAIGGLLTIQRQPVLAPRVAKDLPELAAVAQAAELVRFNVLSVEYAISPDGSLRAWTFLGLRLGVLLVFFLGILLGAAALLGLPMAEVTAKISATILVACHSLSLAANNLLFALLSFTMCIALVILVIFVLGLLLHRVRGRHADDQGVFDHRSRWVDSTESDAL